MYKDKIKDSKTLFKTNKLRVVALVLTVAVVVLLSILKFVGDAHFGLAAHAGKEILVTPGVNDGRKEQIDTSIDSKVVGSISKQEKVSSNHAKFHHKDGQVDDINRHTIITTTPTQTVKQFPTVTPNTSQNTKESTVPNSKETKVVVLGQNSKNGAIKVVDRIDGSLR